MTLLLNMTVTASTTRLPAISSGKIGNPVSHLTNLKIVPLQNYGAVGEQAIRAAIGMEGSAVAIYKTFTQSHAHTDDSVPVTQLPDIVEGDRLVVSGVTYQVRRVLRQPAALTRAQHLQLALTEDKRA